jgi:tRNA(Ser,Leu) C12 N-acetylase TAN1
MDQIIPALSALIEKHLVKHSEESTNPPTYAIDFKARNTKLIEKLKVYDEVTALMKEKSAGCSVNLTKPDLLILVHVCFRN